MLTWTRIGKLVTALGVVLTLSLSVGSAGCASGGLLGSGNANKKQDGEACAKDSECANVCLTAAEAAATPSLQPNTCGKANRVSPN